MQHDTVNDAVEPVRHYRPVARALHWLTVLLVLALVASGMAMTYRGGELNVWDETTNGLYSAHKLIGFSLLWIIVARLIYRLSVGVPPLPGSVTALERFGSATVHSALYLLLLAVPLGGWLGVSMFGALNVFGWFDLPALAPVDKETSKVVLGWHGWFAYVLISVVAVHVLAAVFHGLVRRDGVFERMSRPRGGD